MRIKDKWYPFIKIINKIDDTKLNFSHFKKSYFYLFLKFKLILNLFRN